MARRLLLHVRDDTIPLPIFQKKPLRPAQNCTPFDEVELELDLARFERGESKCVDSGFLLFLFGMSKELIGEGRQSPGVVGGS